MRLKCKFPDPLLADLNYKYLRCQSKARQNDEEHLKDMENKPYSVTGAILGIQTMHEFIAREQNISTKNWKNYNFCSRNKMKSRNTNLRKYVTSSKLKSGSIIDVNKTDCYTMT
uniref:Uncharacterized protein n=1 Tax=Arion vulgaris TaxID=1028688 RepID=A0A0B7BJZ4_9EUPU